MGALSDQIAADARAMLSLEGFGEAAVYTPHNGSPKSIVVIVNRKLPGKLSETINNLTADIEVAVANDATSGVTSVNVGRDKITLSEQWGGNGRAHTVTRIISQDEGVWLVGVR